MNKLQTIIEYCLIGMDKQGEAILRQSYSFNKKQTTQYNSKNVESQI